MKEKTIEIECRTQMKEGGQMKEKWHFRPVENSWFEERLIDWAGSAYWKDTTIKRGCYLNRLQH